MDDFWARAHQLLNIVAMASGHPKLKALQDRAARELEGMNEEVEKQAAQPAAQQSQAAADDDDHHTRRGGRHG
jgi:hypothetical protein